jgi:hypothetical protein
MTPGTSSGIGFCFHRHFRFVRGATRPFPPGKIQTRPGLGNRPRQPHRPSEPPTFMNFCSGKCKPKVLDALDAFRRAAPPRPHRRDVRRPNRQRHAKGRTRARREMDDGRDRDSLQYHGRETGCGSIKRRMDRFCGTPMGRNSCGQIWLGFNIDQSDRAVKNGGMDETPPNLVVCRCNVCDAADWSC